jgi:hypothetical protein
MRVASQLPGPGEYGAPNNPAKINRSGMKMGPVPGHRSLSAEPAANMPGPGQYLSNVSLPLYLHAYAIHTVQADAFCMSLNVHEQALCRIFQRAVAWPLRCVQSPERTCNQTCPTTTTKTPRACAASNTDKQVMTLRFRCADAQPFVASAHRSRLARL